MGMQVFSCLPHLTPSIILAHAILDLDLRFAAGERNTDDRLGGL